MAVCKSGREPLLGTKVNVCCLGRPGQLCVMWSTQTETIPRSQKQSPDTDPLTSQNDDFGLTEFDRP